MQIGEEGTDMDTEKITSNMDKAYHQKWFHAKGMLFPGIIFALIPATLVGLIVTLIR